MHPTTTTSLSLKRFSFSPGLSESILYSVDMIGDISPICGESSTHNSKVGANHFLLGWTSRSARAAGARTGAGGAVGGVTMAALVIIGKNGTKASSRSAAASPECEEPVAC
jgi:hypothetical protein